MMSDLIYRACLEACRRFGDPKLFNAANFSAAFCDLAELTGPLDGRLVAAMLQGREDVLPYGRSHYALRLSKRG